MITNAGTKSTMSTFEAHTMLENVIYKIYCFINKTYIITRSAPHHSTVPERTRLRRQPWQQVTTETSNVEVTSCRLYKYIICLTPTHLS